MKDVTPKRARVIEDYHVEFRGHKLTVKAGTLVTNHTACGCDDNYRFPAVCRPIAETSGLKFTGALVHDLMHYGINVPAEFCGPWEGEANGGQQGMALA